MKKPTNAFNWKKKIIKKSFDLAAINQSKFLKFKYKKKLAKIESKDQQSVIKQLKEAIEVITIQKNAIEQKTNWSAKIYEKEIFT